MAPMGVSSGHVYANEVADAKPDEHSDAVKLHELHAFGPATPAESGRAPSSGGVVRAHN